jgi:hypothetical protein
MRDRDLGRPDDALQYRGEVLRGPGRSGWFGIGTVLGTALGQVDGSGWWDILGRSREVYPGGDWTDIRWWERKQKPKPIEQMRQPLAGGPKQTTGSVVAEGDQTGTEAGRCRSEKTTRLRIIAQLQPVSTYSDV